MKNKTIFGVLLMCAMMVSFAGASAHKANAAVGAKETIVQFKSLDEVFTFLNTTVKAKLLGGDGTTPERMPYWCKETVTFPDGSSTSQSYGSNSNSSGHYCTSNGTGVSVDCASTTGIY